MSESQVHELYLNKVAEKVADEISSIGMERYWEALSIRGKSLPEKILLGYLIEKRVQTLTAWSWLLNPIPLATEIMPPFYKDLLDF